MVKSYVFLFLLVLTMMVFGQTASITVTSENMALVHEPREFSLEQGKSIVMLHDLPKLIDPTSIYFDSSLEGFQILEQQFLFDSMDISSLLEKSVGKDVEIISGTDNTYGKLISFDGSTIIVESMDGYINLIARNSNQILRIKDRDTMDQFTITPTLQWNVSTRKSGKVIGQLNYMTTGLNWRPEYTFVVEENEKSAELSAWVSLSNQSGKDFKDVSLNLLAGELNIVRPQRGPAVYPKSMAFEAADTGNEPFNHFQTEKKNRSGCSNRCPAKLIGFMPITIAKMQTA